MAVDTKQRRMAATTVVKLYHPWVFPDASGITANERAALAGAYSGLFLGPIVAIVVPSEAIHAKVMGGGLVRG